MASNSILPNAASGNSGAVSIPTPYDGTTTTIKKAPIVGGASGPDCAHFGLGGPNHERIYEAERRLRPRTLG
jgi:hypothetical protein